MAKRDSNLNPIGKSRGIRHSATGVADWESVDASEVVRTIAAAGVVGGAIRFGYTTDGGAYSIGIYGDGPPYTEYVKPGESVEDTLKLIQELFISIADSLKKPGSGQIQP